MFAADAKNLYYHFERHLTENGKEIRAKAWDCKMDSSGASSMRNCLLPNSSFLRNEVTRRYPFPFERHVQVSVMWSAPAN